MSTSAKHSKIGQSIAHGGGAYMKSFGQESDCLFIIQIEIVLFDLLCTRLRGIKSAAPNRLASIS
jgi:hypothetical protein